jgi:multidrug efflux system membrane fusion protein
LRRLLGWVLGLLVLGGIAVLLIRHDWSGDAQHGRSLPPQAVGVAVAATGEIPIVDTGLGTVTPLATVTVRTQIAGTLEKIGFREGQMVARGDFLAQIDDRPYQAALRQAQGNLARDQALLDQAKTNYARYSTLGRQDSISRQQVTDQLSLVHQYEGDIIADRGAIDTQNVNIAYCRIVSPVAGRVGLRQVDAGNYVQTSDTNGIVVVTQLQPISVIFSLPEDNLPAIMQQIAAGATLSVTAFDRADAAQLAVGHLETVDNQIDTTTGTVKLRALFDNPGNALFPNQFVNARLLVNTVRNAVTVPNAAIQTGQPGNFVYVVGKDNTVAVQKVTLGAADADHTQIVTGLEAGARVVVDGADRLKDGMTVVVPAAKGSPEAGAAAPTGKHRHRRPQQTQPD